MFDGLVAETDEAAIAYMQKYKQKLTTADLVFLERLMKFNENVRKYATRVNIMDARQALVFARKIVPVLKGLSTANQFYRLE